tara:strand:+ start:1903 stop:2607 length:705 start_codon:yes stop_codon:yes gene_type:complete
LTPKNRKPSYVVASIRSWHLAEFQNINEELEGNWHLIDDPLELTLENLERIKPRYIFFPHWSIKVPEEIIELYECVCFHETDLPFGRGGSPIQNLIERGIETTQITAIRMTKEFDAGPVYIKHPLSLNGLAEEIYIRSAKIISSMIQKIVTTEPIPIPQTGKATVFKRRTPAQSFITEEIDSLEQLFDFIRMLDADGYPLAKIQYNSFEIEFKQPAFRVNKIEAIVCIKKSNKS